MGIFVSMASQKPGYDKEWERIFGKAVVKVKTPRCAVCRSLIEEGGTLEIENDRTKRLLCDECAAKEDYGS